MAQDLWSLCSNSAVRRAARQLGQLYDDAMAPLGLKGTQFTLMAQIAHLEAPALKQLADALVMDLSALGHTLKPLTRDGLVELLPDERDKRVKRVRLTTLGTARYRAGAALWKQAQARFDQAFGVERSKALREAMAEIASADFAKAFGAAEIDRQSDSES